MKGLLVVWGLNVNYPSDWANSMIVLPKVESLYDIVILLLGIYRNNQNN